MNSNELFMDIDDPPKRDQTAAEGRRRTDTATRRTELKDKYINITLNFIHNS